MLLDQSISIIEKNQKKLDRSDQVDERKFMLSVRGQCRTFWNLEAGSENDTEELQKIASLMSIDEIYLFDATEKYQEQNRSTMDTALSSGEQ